MTHFAANNILLRFSDKQKEAIHKTLSVPSKIVITTHYRPDGDAMGSSLGLYNYLKKKGHQVNVVVPSEYPDFLSWLPGSSDVLNYETAKEVSDTLISNAEIIFCLDYNQLNRIELMEGAVRNSKAKRILIDHHLDPEEVFDISVSYQDVSSTCELIFDFILALDDLKSIDKAIAECIYCGIMTDTNSFRYSSMKVRTHHIVAGLIEAGAENHIIHELVYDNSSEGRLRLLGHSLLNKLVILREYNTAYISLSEAELIKFDFKSGDTEGFVNVALGVSGIRLALFFSEKDGMIKISFRSKKDFSVKELSAKYFKGGGHKNASGGSSNDTMENTIKKFVEILPLYKSQLTD